MSTYKCHVKEELQTLGTVDEILIEGLESGKFSFYISGKLNDMINLAGNPIEFTSEDLHLKIFTWDNKFAPKLLKASWEGVGQHIDFFKVGKEVKRAAWKAYKRDKKIYEKYREDMVLTEIIKSCKEITRNLPNASNSQ
jgi:hypothetical protein